MYWHHSITYPDGTEILGVMDHTVTLDAFGITPEFIKDKRVLDLGANDGFLSFWSEWNGAREVVATDVDSYQYYDWGPKGPPPGIEFMDQQNKSEAFWHHHRKTNSEVLRYVLNAYESTRKMLGEFDVIFNIGLIYHLRHPRLCIDNCAEMCKEVMFLETEVITSLRSMGAVCVDAGHELGVMSKTDMVIPSTGAVAHWLINAGFPYVYLVNDLCHRAKFIACKTEGIARQWMFNEKFVRIDRRALAKISEDTQKLLGLR